jgi:hypothetical protein
VLVDPNDDAIFIKSMVADLRGAAIAIGREIEVFYAGNVDDIDASCGTITRFRRPASRLGMKAEEQRRLEARPAPRLGDRAPTTRNSLSFIGAPAMRNPTTRAPASDSLFGTGSASEAMFAAPQLGSRREVDFLPASARGSWHKWC